MPVFKLMYFNTKGLAEVSRLLFAAAGVEYEDERVNRENWPSIKPTTPSGQLPVLVVDGRMFSQSIPIAVYLADVLGLHGTTPLEILRVNEVVSIAADLRGSMGKARAEKDNAKKVAYQKSLKNEDIPRYMKIFERLLSQSDTDYFIEKLSIGDIIVFDTLQQHVSECLYSLHDHPKLKVNMEKVHANPGIKAWLGKRPKTDM